MDVGNGGTCSELASLLSSIYVFLFSSSCPVTDCFSESISIETTPSTWPRADDRHLARGMALGWTLGC